MRTEHRISIAQIIGQRDYKDIPGQGKSDEELVKEIADILLRSQKDKMAIVYMPCPTPREGLTLTEQAELRAISICSQIDLEDPQKTVNHILLPLNPPQDWRTYVIFFKDVEYVQPKGPTIENIHIEHSLWDILD